MGKLLAAVFAAALVAAPRAAHPQDTITAKAKLKEALAEAKKWKPDAKLWSVSTSDAKPDGSAAAWTYNFMSKASKTCYRVVALASRNITSDLGECRYEPIAEEFVDSPEALKSATSGGFKAGETIGLGLGHKIDRNLPSPRDCWTVYSPEKDFDRSKAVMRSWCVDPKTGKFVAHLAGEHPGGKKK